MSVIVHEPPPKKIFVLRYQPFDVVETLGHFTTYPLAQKAMWRHHRQHNQQTDLIHYTIVDRVIINEENFECYFPLPTARTKRSSTA